MMRGDHPTYANDSQLPIRLKKLISRDIMIWLALDKAIIRLLEKSLGPIIRTGV